MKKISISANRRAFLRGALATAPAAVAAGAGALSTVSFVARAQSSAPYKPVFFDQAAFELLTSLVDTMIPADETGPGAVEAGVAEFIDAQMNTPYGKGELWYMQGPFDPKAPAVFGYQLPYSPAELYRRGLAELASVLQKQYGKSFSQLNEAERIDVVTALEKATLPMTEVPAGTLFGQVLQNVHEGYFCDPADGGNKGMGAWKMIGFPGARADYYDWVEQYGKRYPLPPVSRG